VPKHVGELIPCEEYVYCTQSWYHKLNTLLLFGGTPVRRLIGTQAILKNNFSGFFSATKPEFLLSSLHYSSLMSQCRGPRGLRRMSATACLLGLWVRIPPGAWLSVSYVCCVVTGRGLCDGPIPRPGQSYQVCVYD